MELKKIGETVRIGNFFIALDKNYNFCLSVQDSNIHIFKKEERSLDGKYLENALTWAKQKYPTEEVEIVELFYGK